MRYQLESGLAQVKHVRMAQAQEMGMVQEWVFPREKELEKALEFLRAQGLETQSAQEKVQVLETDSDLVQGMWE